MRPDVLEGGYARVQEFAQKKIAELKSEIPTETTPEVKVDKPKKPAKAVKSGK